MRCFRAGPPFRMRRKNGVGLAFPAGVKHWPIFICEACTVRSVLGRELRFPRDVPLLCLERMSILDRIWYLAEDSHKTYQGKVNVIKNFERTYGVPILTTPVPRVPPAGPDVTLLWCQEAYSLQDAGHPGEDGVDLTISFATVRQLRSVVGYFDMWASSVVDPGSTYLSPQRQLLLGPGRPSDSASHTMHATGLRARLGTHTRPSFPLSDRHVRYLDKDLNARYLAAVTEGDLALARELSLASLANLTLWLLWLRSRETFDTDWEDIRVVRPGGTPHTTSTADHMGFVGWRLQAETKSERSRRVDTLAAYRTQSGYRYGEWVARARSHSQGTGPVFAHSNGTRWTSLFFRKKYLYPSLYKQREAGDSLLRVFTNRPGNRIEDKFWSLHCYRRGSRSHVSSIHIPNPYGLIQANNTQIYVHGCWSATRASEAVDKQYLHWDNWQKLQITLFCY